MSVSARPWWPDGRASAMLIARQFRDSNDDESLFELLTVAAAGSQGPIFSAALEELCGISENGVQAMLGHISLEGWGPLYAMTKLPRPWLPLFIEILRNSPSAGQAHTTSKTFDAKETIFAAIVQVGLDLVDLPRSFRQKLLR